MIYGFATFAGSEALALRRVWNYVHWAAGFEPPTMSDIYAFRVFADKGPCPIPWTAQSAAIALRSHQVEIRPVPERAWLAERTRLVADWREAAGRLAAGHDARQSALIEQPLSVTLGSDSVATAGASRRSVRWVNFSRNHLTLETDSSAPAVLALSEAWYPGWQGSVNGATTAVFPVNGWMRGVAVPAGVARVEFRYRPTHFGLGVGISVVALIVVAWLARPISPARFSPRQQD
jgi:hypothetical protein